MCWDMAAYRKETAAWVESDTCQVCNYKITTNYSTYSNNVSLHVYIYICERMCVCVCVRARACVRACVYMYI